MADFSLQEYLNKLGGIPAGSNLEASPAQYLPQGRRVTEYNDSNAEPGRVGMFSPTTVQMNTSPMERKFALETLLHEAAHTTQSYLPHMFNPRTRQLRDIPYEGYLDATKGNTPTTDVDEVLAALRAQEGLLKKGQSVLSDSKFGRDYVKKVETRTGMKPQEAQAYVRQAMNDPHSTFKDWAAKYFAK